MLTQKKRTRTELIDEDPGSIIKDAPQIKKQKLDNKNIFRTRIFKHEKDIEQCKSIFFSIYESTLCTKLSFPSSITVNIAEYATGLVYKCANYSEESEVDKGCEQIVWFLYENKEEVDIDTFGDGDGTDYWCILDHETNEMCCDECSQLCHWTHEICNIRDCKSCDRCNKIGHFRHTKLLSICPRKDCNEMERLCTDCIYCRQNIVNMNICGNTECVNGMDWDTIERGDLLSHCTKHSVKRKSLIECRNCKEKYCKECQDEHVFRCIECDTKYCRSKSVKQSKDIMLGDNIMKCERCQELICPDCYFGDIDDENDKIYCKNCKIDLKDQDSYYLNGNEDNAYCNAQQQYDMDDMDENDRWRKGDYY